ncbi:hypothetical protein [Paraburkholderia azotifigens]|uniref:hypothetical protein n=1 Tax=Paraburkholderia azotifigens TaxID=2057004 RepID=UPI0038B9CAB1
MTENEIRASMTSEQILLERKLTCEAINGAIAFGYLDTNPPPADDHWLAPFWKIGRERAELESNVSTLSAPAVDADVAWDAYLDEQKRILGMPGLMARPSFIAGYRAALSARASEAAAGEPTATMRDRARWFARDFSREAGFSMSDAQTEAMLNLLLRYAAPPAASEDAYVAQRMSETLADVYLTIIGDDAPYTDESPNAIERVKKAASVLRLEVELYRASANPAASGQKLTDLQAEVERLNAIINTPHADDFLKAVSIEAEHQRQRWGSNGDAGKTPADWFWLVGYLAGKALHAHAAGNVAKAEHHIITTAAACANWHRNMFGKTEMRPGIDGDAALTNKVGA